MVNEDHGTGGAPVRGVSGDTSGPLAIRPQRQVIGRRLRRAGGACLLATAVVLTSLFAAAGAMADVPSAATNLTATPLAGGTTVRLNFTPPASGTPFVGADYRVKTGNGPYGGWTSSQLSTVNQVGRVNVTGLTPDTDYTFQVRIKNSSGAGPRSNEATVTTLAPSGAPSAATNLTATPLAGGTTVRLNFTPPASGTPFVGADYRVKTGNGPYGGWTSSQLSTVNQVGRVNVTGLTPDTDYTFQVRIKNSSGAGPRSNEATVTTLAPSGAPSAATNLTATPLAGGTTVRLNFTPPASGTPFVGADYRVKTGNGPYGGWTSSQLSTVNQVGRVNVTGLTPDTDYTFQVRIKNSSGAGPRSNEATVTTLAPSGAPSAATNLTATPLAGGTTVRLRFTPPASGRPFQGADYRVKTGNGPYGDWTSSQLSTVNQVGRVNVTGLTPGTDYTFQVRIKNSSGAGPRSNEATVTTLAPSGAPSAATNLTATPLAGGTTVRLRFTPPASGRPFQGADYRVKMGNGPYGDWTSSQLSTVNQVGRVNVTGLTPGTDYTFQVRIKNSSGAGPRSNEATVTTKGRPDVPTAPRNLHAKGDSSTEIDLSWRAPAKTGGPGITGYRIEVSTDGGMNWADLVADTASTDTTHSHTGLTMGDTRHYRVSAINAVGTGPVSDVASATAVATPPGLASAVVERTNSLVVRLEFNELVDTTSIPDKSAFAVEVEGDAREVTSFTVTDEGGLGWLGLASRARPGETVTLSYTKPGTNPLKDTTGNEMVSFADHIVTNETSTDFPILSMAGAEAEESGDPNNPETTIVFTVSVDTEPDFPVGVHYETEDVDATGGASCSDSPIPDYISTEGRLTLGPGESRKQVEVTVCDDTVVDGGETFRLVLRSTQLHESIEEIEARGTIREYDPDEETGSQTGTILNDESDIEVSIAADAAYVAEGADAAFTLRRTGDAEAALTVPVAVAEDGAALETPVPESVTFEAGSSQASLRVPTEDDGTEESDSTVTATLAAGDAWLVAAGGASASLTVLDNDTAPVTSTTSADVTVWSANMTVVDYENGNIGAGSADLLANQGGSADLTARWLYYDTGQRTLKIAFSDGLADAESMTLHVGDLSVAFPADSGGDSSFTIGDVDVSWTDGETLAARITKPAAAAVSTDATLASLTVSGAELSPAFDAGVLVYRVEVAAETETVTIAATANDGGASIAYGPGEDADTALADFQISTPSGETLVEVTVTAADGRTARSYRVVLARAAVNTAPAGLPEISGTPKVGETLTASVAGIADADGSDNAQFAYQWLAHDGTDDTAIAGATGATHEVAADDAGKALKVRVTFTDDKGTEEVLTSAATETVVDRRSVAATLLVGDGAAEAGRFRLRIAFGDAVTGLALADLAASRVGGDAAAVSELAETETETGRAWTAWVAADAGRYTVRLAAGAAESGERRSLASVLAVDVDAAGNATAVAGPVVTSVGLAAASDGTWTEGETVRLTLGFSEPVTVATTGGTPTVGIALDGAARQATYASGSGRVAVFTYAVTADDGTVTSVSLTADSLALNGGTIRDAGARDADLDHPGIGAAVTQDTEQESASVLTGLKLVDTGTGTETALADGAALVLDDPANGSWGLVASVAPEAQVGSVRLVLTGGNTVTAATDDAAPWSLYGDEDGTVKGAALPAGSYTLKATAYAEAAGGGTALGTLSASFTVAASEAVAPDALTASFEGVPEAHDGPGSEAFTFRVRFSQEPRVSYAVLRDESFAVTGGGVRRARRVDGRNDLREIHVEPEGWDDVRVTLAGGRACGTEGAICTADNKVLANTAVATVPGPLALSVADAEAREGPGVTLDFVVTLSRAASGTVTVDYATADGTATAGADYTAASGTLTFDPGETAKTVSVPVLDDAHDDTDETLTLTLSNASGARIRDGEATGTIENSDPIPQAWLARFGRTVADHVVDAVTERLTGSPGGGSQVTLGGQAIPLDGVLNGAGSGPSSGGAAGGDTREKAAAADTLAAFADRISGDGAGGERGTAWARRGEGSGEDAATGRETRGLTERELLLGSSFVLSLGGAEANGSGTAWTAWGRAAASRFDGEADGLSLDGDVTTFTFGADAARGRWLGGVALAHSTGEGGYRDHDDSGDPNHPGRGSGTLESSLTSVHPYARLAVSERLSLWGLLGYGAGDLTLAVDAAGDRPRQTWKTETEMQMAAAGARGVLLSAADHGGFELAARGDARLVRMNSDAATGAGAAGRLSESESQTSRLRFILEGSHRIEFAGGQTLTPILEVGLRHDGGDAETGTGIELGGGVSYADPATGLSVTAKARGLLAHEDAGYTEWGASGSVKIDPGAAGRGLSLSLAPAWGADSGNAERLWGLADARGLAGNESFEPAGRLDAEAGWGFGAFGGRGLATPFAGLSLSDAGERTWRSGVRWTLGPDTAFGVEAIRREAANDNAAEHGVEFRLRARF